MNRSLAQKKVWRSMSKEARAKRTEKGRKKALEVIREAFKSFRAKAGDN